MHECEDETRVRSVERGGGGGQIEDGMRRNRPSIAVHVVPARFRGVVILYGYERWREGSLQLQIGRGVASFQYPIASVQLDPQTLTSFGAVLIQTIHR